MREEIDYRVTGLATSHGDKVLVTLRRAGMTAANGDHVDIGRLDHRIELPRGQAPGLGQRVNVIVYAVPNAEPSGHCLHCGARR